MARKRTNQRFVTPEEHSRAMDNFHAMHLQELPDPKAELERAFGFLVEKRSTMDTDDMTGCTSLVQRKLQCGYNRAARLLEDMEAQGWITAPDKNGARRLIRPR